jgi:hypothetical protein
MPELRNSSKVFPSETNPRHDVSVRSQRVRTP